MFNKIMEIFKDNWENIIPAVLAIPVLAADLMGSDIFPEGTVESMTLAMLIAIAVAQVRNNYGGEIVEKVNTSITKMDDIFSISRGNVSVVKPKDEPSIWQNFKGRLFYLNPPLALAENSNVQEDVMLSNYANTFASNDLVSVTYIFYKDGEPGFHYPDAIKFFVKFCKFLEANRPEVLKKLKVVYVDDRKAPSYTFFLGKKGASALREKTENKNTLIPYSILYLGEHPFTNRMGVPSLALASINDQLNDKLEDVIEGILDNHKTKSAIEFLEDYK